LLFFVIGSPVRDGTSQKCGLKITFEPSEIVTKRQYG
jgi:hypothetical protein